MLKNNAPQKALAFNIVLDGYAKYFFKFRLCIILTRKSIHERSESIISFRESFIFIE